MSANLGGVGGADAICAAEAAAAGLEGTFLAWLSDATHSPKDRPPQSTGPYVLPDDTRSSRAGQLWPTTCPHASPSAPT